MARSGSLHLLRLFVDQFFSYSIVIMKLEFFFLVHLFVYIGHFGVCISSNIKFNIILYMKLALKDFFDMLCNSRGETV